MLCPYCGRYFERSVEERIELRAEAVSASRSRQEAGSGHVHLESSGLERAYEELDWQRSLRSSWWQVHTGSWSRVVFRDSLIGGALLLLFLGAFWVLTGDLPRVTWSPTRLSGPF